MWSRQTEMTPSSVMTRGSSAESPTVNFINTFCTAFAQIFFERIVKPNRKSKKAAQITLVQKSCV